LTGSLAGLLAANVLYLVIGIALMPLLRIARTRAELTAKLGLAYMVGVAATGVLSAHLALVDVPVGLTELVVLALIIGVAAWRRLRRIPEGPSNTLSFGQGQLAVASRVIGVAAFLVTLVLLAHTLNAFSVRPLVEWDGWAIWAMKARALYDFGGVAHGVFTTQPYGPLQHPLMLPALEATGFRSMGAFDGTLIHVQLALLAFGFAAFLASLAGILYVWWSGQIAPGNVDLPETINLLVMAVIGGLWRIEGAWLGAFAFIVIQNYVRDFHVPGLSFGGTLFGGSFNTVIGIIFLLIVLVSPEGLMGIWDRGLGALTFARPSKGAAEGPQTATASSGIEPGGT